MKSYKRKSSELYIFVYMVAFAWIIGGSKADKENCKRCLESKPHDQVCGSDGRTYHSKCALKRKACRKEIELTIAYRGECFDTVATDNPEYTNTANPQKTSPSVGADIESPPTDLEDAGVICPVCSKPTKPDKVCGTDGKTYSSKCVLTRNACLQNSNIQVAHGGKCERNYNLKTTKTLERTTIKLAPTEHIAVLTPATSKHTTSTQSPSDLLLGTTRTRNEGLRCPVCSKPTQPDKVCGTDGKTYSSKCVLTRKACLQKSNIQVAHGGKCERHYNLKTTKTPERTTIKLTPTEHTAVLKPATSKHTTSTQSPSDIVLGTTRTRKEGGMCVRCPMPSSLSRQVCGSDGKTYPTRCILRRKACIKGYDLTVEYLGECVATTTSTITRNVDENTIVPKRSKNRKRPETRPETIPTPSTRRRTSGYSTEQDISSRTTYSMNTLREMSTPPTILTYDEDDDEDADEVEDNGDNDQEERRPANCTVCPKPSSVSQQVCGSDGETYFSMCLLKRSACKTAREITTLHTGRCKQSATQELTTQLTTVTTELANTPQLSQQKRPRPSRGPNATTGKHRDQEGPTQAPVKGPNEIESRLIPKIVRPEEGADSDEIEDECEQCPQPTVNDFVCSADGKTYSSTCLLRRLSCVKGVPLVVAHRGRCANDVARDPMNYRPNKIVGPKRIPSGRPDTDTSKGIYDNTCQKKCQQPERRDRVCASDGLTYSSRCILRRSACQSKTYITIVHKGRCMAIPTTEEAGLSEEENDDNSDEDDAQQFPTRSSVNAVAETHLHAGFKQATDSVTEVPTSVTDTPTTVTTNIISTSRGCSGMCSKPTKAEKVCGSDGVTYSSACSLKKKSCSFGTRVAVAYKGKCKKQSQKSQLHTTQTTTYPPPPTVTEEFAQTQTRFVTSVKPTVDYTVPLLSTSSNQETSTEKSSISVFQSSDESLVSLQETVDEDNPSEVTSSPNVECPTTTYCLTSNPQEEIPSEGTAPTETNVLSETLNRLSRLVSELTQSLSKILEELAFLKSEIQDCEPLQESSTDYCLMDCSNISKPVCGTDQLNYPSECVLNKFKCVHSDTELAVAYDGKCQSAK